MKSVLGTTFVHATIYTLGIILNRVISFLMLPIYTHFLSPEDYGILELLEMTVDVITILAGIGMLNGLAKFYYDYESADEQQELVSTLFTMTVAIYFVACAGGVLLSQQLSLVVFGNENYADLIRISFINLFLQVLIYTPMAYIRVQQKSALFVVINGAKLLLQLSFNILFIIFLKMGVAGVLYGTLLSSVAIGGWLAFYILPQVRFQFSTEQAKRLLRFGLPFIVSGLGAFVLTFSDRYFLSYYHDLTLVGVYALAYKFGFLLAMFPVAPLMNIWMVQRFEIASNEGYERIFNQFLSWFTISVATVMLAVAFTVRDLLKVISSSGFWPASDVVPVILMAYFFQGCTDFFNFGIYYSGKTEHMAYGTILAVLVIVGLSFLLIPKYGMYGAAWATLLSFSVRLVYVYWASQRLFRIKYALARPVCTTIIAVAIYLIYDATVWTIPSQNSPLVFVSYRLFLFSAFFAILCHLNIIEPQVRRLIFDSIRRPLKTFGELKALYHT
jgi:O-antigen/teichoic acid export membrane protein